MNPTENKDRKRLIELAKRATAEEVQNHLDAFDGSKVIVDYDGPIDEDSEMEELEVEARPLRVSSFHDHNTAFRDGFAY